MILLLAERRETRRRRGVYVVTRQKHNAQYKVIEQRPLPYGGKIHKDEVIEPRGYYSAQKCGDRLRTLQVGDEENELNEIIVNHLSFWLSDDSSHLQVTRTGRR